MKNYVCPKSRAQKLQEEEDRKLREMTLNLMKEYNVSNEQAMRNIM